MNSARMIVAVAFALLAACGRNAPDIADEPLEPTVEPAAPAEGAAPLTPAAAPFYVGVWAEADEDCAVKPGSADASPIALTETEYFAFDRRCRVGETEEGTEGGYLIGLVCLEDGVEVQQALELDVDGRMLRLRSDGGEERIYVRCPDAPTP